MVYVAKISMKERDRGGEYGNERDVMDKDRSE